MAKPNSTTSSPTNKNLVPVAIVSCCTSEILLPYAQQIIQSLQALHPQTQLVITCITPTSHSIPINPFLPPQQFLSSLPSFVRRPTRPASTLWQSSTGMLKAIRLARRRLVEGPLAGAGGEGRAQLPKYVVVVSGTDVENQGGEEVCWEDEENEGDWETLAKNFTKGNHCTTLFSLISLGSTPNLELFWKESSGRFPPHLIYNSTASTIPPGFSFPLVAPSHACFLIGFYNANRPSQALPPSNGAATASPQSQPISASTPNSTTTNANAKRPAPASPVINNNQAKKSKPNPSSTSSTTPALPANSPPNPAGAFLTGNRIQQQPTPPNSTRPTNSTAPPSINQSPLQQRNGSPSMPPALPSSFTNESLQRYIEEMKAVAARTGQPPPSAQDIQNAAMAAYQNAQRSASGSSLSLQTPRSNGGGTNLPTPTSAQNFPREISQLTPQQIQALPSIPPEMKVKIEAHLELIRNKVKTGIMAEDEGQRQVKRLQDLANHQRLKMHQHELAKQQQIQNQNQSQQQQPSGLGLNISPQLAHSRQPSSTPSQPQQQQQNPQQYQNQNQPQPPQPKRQDSLPNKPIWRGAISWALTEASGARKEFTIYCEAAPMQSSAARELAEVQLPATFRINSLSQLKMPVLQELASKHTLPAISLTPLSNSVLPPELVEKQKQNGHNNEALYTMFAQSIEHRSNCGIVRFSGSPNGLVLVAVPNQNKLLAIVFAKIPLPPEWAQSSSSTSSSNPQTQSQQHSRTSTAQSQAPQRPPSSQSLAPPPQQQQQSGMFSSPASYPLSLPPNQPPPHSPYLAQPFAGANQNQPYPQQQHFNNYAQPPPQQIQQQQNQAPSQFPQGGVAGMDFAELQKLLGADQLNAIMSGI